MGGFTKERKMKRKTFDKFVTFLGAGLTVFLFVVAALANWGASFASDSVQSQLQAQEITMPPASAAARSASPENKAAAEATVETVFKGNMLRGTLLTAYAFGTLGELAGYGAMAALIGALLMLVFTILGVVHLRRTPEEAMI